MASNGNKMHESEKVNTNIVTLTRFLTEEQAKHPEATGDFTYDAAYLGFHDTKLTIAFQPALPRSPVLFQVHRLLHPTRHPRQPDRSGWFLQHHGRRPEEARRHLQ